MLQRKMLLYVFPLFLAIFQLPIQFKIGKCEREVFDHSNSGEFSIEWKHVGPCESGKGTNEIQLNIKLKRKNRRPMLCGNCSFLIPWDETVSLELQYAKLGSNAAWMKNSFFLTMAGCTQYRLLAGNAVQGKLNLPKQCPMPKGVYVINEFDVEKVVENLGPLAPKTFFYGSYKLSCDFKKSNKRVGCTQMVFDVVPKWQRRNKTRYGN